MIPEVSVPQIDAKADGRVLLDPLHDDELRDVPLLRAQSAKLVNEVGELLRRHAAEMGAASGYTCAFQVDRFGQLLIWQLCEMFTQSGCAPAVITLQHVSKHFEGRRRVTALQDINLDISKGELVSIVGPSGSGKSTLLNLIGGLDRPTSGAITLDGQRLDGLADDGLTAVRRDKLGFIFQFFNLLPSLSCVENVALPLHLRGWPRKKIHERARELLDLVKLSERMDHLPDELSGGERQRVAIARALSVYPPILLADEPTGNLDTQTGADILRLVSDLHTTLGSTILIVTHDATVAHTCQRTITIRDGKIVGDVRR